MIEVRIFPNSKQGQVIPDHRHGIWRIEVSEKRQGIGFHDFGGKGMGEEMDQGWELEGNGDWRRGGGAAIVSPDNCQTKLRAC